MVISDRAIHEPQTRLSAMFLTYTPAAPFPPAPSKPIKSQERGVRETTMPTSALLLRVVNDGNIQYLKY